MIIDHEGIVRCRSDIIPEEIGPLPETSGHPAKSTSSCHTLSLSHIQQVFAATTLLMYSRAMAQYPHDSVWLIGGPTLQYSQGTQEGGICPQDRKRSFSGCKQRPDELEKPVSLRQDLN